jgi:hypothetical protein
VLPRWQDDRFLLCRSPYIRASAISRPKTRLLLSFIDQHGLDDVQGKGAVRRHHCRRWPNPYRAVSCLSSATCSRASRRMPKIRLQDDGWLALPAGIRQEPGRALSCLASKKAPRHTAHKMKFF